MDSTFMEEYLINYSLIRFWRLFWSYLYSDQNALPVFVGKMLTRTLSKRSLPPSTTLKRHFLRQSPYISRIPQSVAGSSLYGSFAYAQIGSFPFENQEEEEEGEEEEEEEEEEE
ncbi:hypothetical protein J6590_020210 [Homalodisca vitripennis]|nr:hypothetical protein J6590_020210 [Homalodisca vitripennis]